MSTIWTVGIDGYKKHELCENTFKTTIIDQDFEPNRSLDLILQDHIRNQLKTGIELLYSGGMDSELVLKVMHRNKIPVTAVTMVFKIKDFIVNPADLYYTEKFCREHSIKHVLIPLDLLKFFGDGVYLEYAKSYQVTVPLTLTYFWLIEQCKSFPVFGGDWPWVDINADGNVLSTFNYNSHCIDLYLQNNNIPGIGNMLSHSFESACFLIKRQMQTTSVASRMDPTGALLKSMMYDNDLEPRIKNYSWSYSLPLLNMDKYNLELRMLTPKIVSEIKWGEKITAIIHSTRQHNRK